jgi:hypothetical protein
MTCQDFAGPFVQEVGGYLNNENATADCQYCQYKSGDEYTASKDYYYADRWRNVWIFGVYILFNIVAMLALYYLFRVASLKRRSSERANKKVSDSSSGYLEKDQGEAVEYGDGATCNDFVFNSHLQEKEQYNDDFRRQQKFDNYRRHASIDVRDSQKVTYDQILETMVYSYQDEHKM